MCALCVQLLCVQWLSCVQLFVTPWIVTHQAPLSVGLFQARILEWKEKKKEYWSGLPFPPPRDLPNSGSNLCLLYLLHFLADSLPLSHLGARQSFS